MKGAEWISTSLVDFDQLGEKKEKIQRGPPQNAENTKARNAGEVELEAAEWKQEAEMVL